MSNDVVTYEPTNFQELEVFCKRITATAMVPQAYRNKPEEAAATIMFGKEIGLPPMTSLQFIANINGRPGVYGDALPGIAMNKGLIRHMREWTEGEPYHDDYTAWCEVFRPDGSKALQHFSVADAKKANLWGKQGPWTQYPRRMLQWRARGWAIRDAAPNLLFGMTAEELQDIEISERHRGPDAAKDITPEAPALSPRAAVDAALAEDEPGLPFDADVIDEDGVILDPDPLKIDDLDFKGAIGTLEMAIGQATAAEADRYLAAYAERIKGKSPKAFAALAQLVAAKIEGGE